MKKLDLFTCLLIAALAVVVGFLWWKEEAHKNISVSKAGRWVSVIPDRGNAMLIIDCEKTLIKLNKNSTTITLPLNIGDYDIAVAGGSRFNISDIKRAIKKSKDMCSKPQEKQQEKQLILLPTGQGVP